MSIFPFNTLSFSVAKQSLLNYVNSLPDENKWKGYFASTAGRLIIELLSGFVSFISYLVVINYREIFITFANNISALIGLSQNLGYSTFRGQNQILGLTVTSSKTMELIKYEPVGTFESYTLYTNGNYSLNNNEPTNIEVIVSPTKEGTDELKSEELEINSILLTFFRFTQPNVSNDVRLYLNGVQVEYSYAIEDLNVGKFVLLSNPLGSVDVFSLNLNNQYKVGDKLKLEYIEYVETNATLNSLITSPYNYFTINNLYSNTPFSPKATSSEIRIKAPLYHEVLKKIRGRSDYLKTFQDLLSNSSNVNDHDISPSVVGLTYVNKDQLLLTQNQITDSILAMSSYRQMGIVNPEIVHPKLSELNLNITVKKNSSISSSVDVGSDVYGIISKVEQKFNNIIDLEQMESDIENTLSYVKIARVLPDIYSWTADSLNKTGWFVNPSISNGKYFQARNLMTKSGTSEPIWNINVANGVLLNSITVDELIEWECVPRIKNPDMWTSLRNYRIGDVIIPTILNNLNRDLMFRVKNIIRQSGVMIPTFSTSIGSYTVDNEIVWICKTLSDADSIWQASNTYRLGNTIKQGFFSYQVIAYLAKSGNTEPNWIITDTYSMLNADHLNKTVTVSGDLSSTLLPQDIFKIMNSTGNNGFYTISSFTVSLGNTVITTVENLFDDSIGVIKLLNMNTYDNEIQWEAVDNDNTLFNYDWNEYIKGLLDVNYNITLI